MRGEKIKNLILMVLTITLVFGINIKALKADADFDKFIKPMTNPVYFDEPFNRTYVQLLTAYQHLPSSVNTTLGDIPLDGHLQVTAWRITYAVNDRLAIVAAKDGYIDFAPKYVLSHQSGWGDIAGGLKYALIRDPKDEFILSAKVLFEFSQGSRSVFQGNGSGNAAPSLTFLKGWENFEFVGMLGGVVPFDCSQSSTELNDSWHVSYDIIKGLWCEDTQNKIFPLIELNHFHVTKSGNYHSNQFPEIAASIVKFEGGDVINLGAPNAGDHPDFVTLGFGFRYRSLYPCFPLDFGFAYEFPLTSKENGLMSNRLSWDLIYRF